MCSSDLIDALTKTKYFSEELITAEKIDDVKISARNKAQEAIKKIFEDKNEALVQKFDGEIQ